jgi:TolA-binding protein
MSAMPSPVHDFPAGLPVRGTLNPDDLDDDPFASHSDHQPEPAVRRSSTSRIALLITFCVGIAVTMAWYSFGGPVREAIAGMSPQLAWVAPQPVLVAAPAADPATPGAPSLDQQLSAASQDIDAVRQNVDRIATAQDQIIKSIGQLSAGQEQLTKEIAKLQAVEQYILYKNSEPPATTRSAPAPAGAPARRPAGPMQITPAPQSSSAAPAPH